MPCVASIWSGDASPRRPSYEEEGNGYYGATVTTVVTVTDTYRCPRCQGGTTVSGQQKTDKQPFCHSAQPRWPSICGNDAAHVRTQNHRSRAEPDQAATEHIQQRHNTRT